MAFSFPPAPVGAIYLATLRMTYVSQQCMNTFYWRVSSNPAGDLVNQISNGLDLILGTSNFYLRHNELRDTGCNLDRVSIQMIAPNRFVPQEFVKNMPGTVLSSVDTANLAAVITRRSSNATRGGVGAIHIPIPQAVEVYVDGLFSIAYTAKLTALAALMQVDLTMPSGAILTPVIYHPNAEVQQPNFSAIGAAFPQSTVRVMRRRTVGLGI